MCAITGELSLWYEAGQCSLELSDCYLSYEFLVFSGCRYTVHLTGTENIRIEQQLT